MLGSFIFGILFSMTSFKHQSHPHSFRIDTQFCNVVFNDTPLCNILSFVNIIMYCQTYEVKHSPHDQVIKNNKTRILPELLFASN